jgi:MYXO-CTERM domain-containing protein
MRYVFRLVAATVGALLMLMLWSSPALAASWKLKSNEASEVSGAWHIYVSIEMTSPPGTAHVPMKFMFTKNVVYERSLVDGSKDPVTNRQPLTGQMPQVESLDVDFADGSGKIFKGTRFDFGVTRTRGFEAGEYKMELKTADGLVIGSPQNLILKGDNPVVDRRSITFNAKDPKIKKVDAVDGGQTAKNDVEANTGGMNEVAPSGSAAPFIPADAYKPTDEETIKDKPGGCGCDVPGLGRTGTAALALPALALLLLIRRRRGV